jgi:hypothetical protein
LFAINSRTPSKTQGFPEIRYIADRKSFLTVYFSLGYSTNLDPIIPSLNQQSWGSELDTAPAAIADYRN